MNHPRLTAAVLSIALLGGCASEQELAELVRAEAIIEEGREALEALPARTPEEEAILAEARAEEAALERKIANAARFTKRGWIDTAMEGIGKGASQDYTGLLGMLGALVTAAGGFLLVDKRGKKNTADLEARIERTLAPQGIAGLTASSAERERSDVAKASRLARESEQDRWLASRRTSTDLTSSLAPRVTVDDLVAALNADVSAN